MNCSDILRVVVHNAAILIGLIVVVASAVSIKEARAGDPPIVFVWSKYSKSDAFILVVVFSLCAIIWVTK